MERYHIYKLGLAILFYAVYFARQTVVNGLKIDDVTNTTSTTDYRERRDSGDDNAFFYQGADGTPGKDFPTLSYVPRTKFSCRDMEAGYYADLETDCQVFHICDEGRKLSFLCPNGTTFQQAELICDWWFKVNCTTSPLLYEESAEILHKENAKRKESRRHGTKQGVFSSREDNGYEHGSFRVTPAHLVTSSYPYKSSVKTVDNRISATTESFIRRDYNTRGDRTLESVGNGVRERDYDKTNSGRGQNTFGANLQAKYENRGQFSSSSTVQSDRREGGFNTNFHGKVDGHDETTFGSNTATQQKTGSGQILFGRGSQQGAGRRDQNTFGTDVQVNFGENLSEKPEVSQQGVFGAKRKCTGACQNQFGGNSQQTAVREQNRFGGIGQNTFSTNRQGKADGQGEYTFGSSAQQKPSGVHNRNFPPLDRSSQKISDQSVFGGHLESTTSSFGRKSFSASSQRNLEIGTQGKLGGAENRNSQGGRQQSVFGTNLQGTVGGFGQNSFGANVQAKSVEQEQTTFGTGTQQKSGGVENHFDRSFQGGRQQNVFGANLQGTVGGFGQNSFGANVQAKSVEQEQTTFGTGTQQKSESVENNFDRSSQGGRQQNVFGANVQGTVTGPGQNSFGANIQGKPVGREQTHFGVSTQQRSGGGEESSFDRNLQDGREKNNAFGANLQQTANSFGQNNFGANLQGKPVGQDQTNFGTSTQQKSKGPEEHINGEAGREKSVFGTNLQETVIGFGQNKFEANLQGKTVGQDQTSFGVTTQQRSGGVGQSNFDKTSQVEREKSTFGANLQGTVTGFGQNNFDANLQGKTVGQDQTSFGVSTQQRSGGVEQSNFDTTSQVGREKSVFGTNLQGTANGFGQNNFDANLQGKPAEREKISFGVTRDQKNKAEQNTFRTISQTLHSGQDTNIFEPNLQGRGQAAFSTSTQESVREGGQSSFGVTSQEKPVSGHFNIFGTSSTGKYEQKTDGTRLESRPDKIRFSISSQGKSDEFGNSKQQQEHGGYEQNAFSSGFEQTTTGRESSGLIHNSYDVDVQGKLEHTTRFGLKTTQSTFGLTAQRGGFTSDGEKIPVNIVSSAETQEPQETASFVKNSRNNLQGQGFTKSYPNHRATYSEIKDPRLYYEKSQSKLPEKPFYGSSVSPQVLSTVPVSSRDNGLKSTTEISAQTDDRAYNFGFKSDVTTKQTSFNAETTTFRASSYIPTSAPFAKSNDLKSVVTTNRYSFGLDAPPQTSKTNFGLSLESSGTNRGDLLNRESTSSASFQGSNYFDTKLTSNKASSSGQFTDKSGTLGLNNADINSYNNGYTSGVDLNLNSVSSTLSPNIQEKSTVFFDSQKNKYKDGKSSTPVVGINNFGSGGYRTTQKPYTDSPVIKLNIIPSTASPDFESDREGKSFNLESPKTQVITYQSSKTPSPFGISGGGRGENSLSVSLGGGDKGSIGSSHRGYTGDVFSTTPTNSFSAVTGIALSTSVPIIGFGGSAFSTPETKYENNLISSTPNDIQNVNTFEGKPISNSNRVQFTINKEAHSTATSIGGGLVDLNVNNQSYSFPLTVTGRAGVTSPTVETETLKFTINDQLYTTHEATPTQTIKINVNGQNANLGITATAATPSKEESTSNNIYTSQSNILQPKPFSFTTRSSAFDKVGVTEEAGSIRQPGLPQLPPYKISSASPFATTAKHESGLESKTLTPTLPTRFATEATLYPYKPTDENVNNMINTLMEVVRQRLAEGTVDNSYGTPRPGLVVPPSAGPQTLHTLAIYFANALDNLTSSSVREPSENTDDESETNSPIIHIDNEELIKSLLTQMTLTNYSDLFKESDGTTTETTLLYGTGSDDSENDLIREDTKHPGTEGPGVRQLARVFTEALSAYLEDPDTFKKVLHDVRPTEPPQSLSSNETAELEDDEVLNYSDSDLKSDHPHLPTRPTGIPVSPTWGYILAYDNKSVSAADNNLESRNSLGSENENLQSADSQSFVSQFNKVTHALKTTPTSDLTASTITSDVTATTTETAYTDFLDEYIGKTLPDNHWTTSSDVTKLWQTTLSINPALLNENFDSTQDFASGSGETSSNGDGQTPISEIQYELRALPKLELNSTQVHGILIDFMNTTKTEGSVKLQRLLNKLNITQGEFLTKMKEIETNPLTRRLILLLISECNTDRNKELGTKTSLGDGVFGLSQSRLSGSRSELPLSTHSNVERETDSDTTTESNLFKNVVHHSLDDDDEDTRALELLNSLYVIASKFGK